MGPRSPDLRKEQPLVLIAAHPNTVDSLQRSISTLPISTVTTTTLTEAVQFLSEHNPAILICDQELSDTPGTELLKLSTTIKPDAVRILLTSLDDAEKLTETVNLGQVSGIIPNPSSETTIQQVIDVAIKKWQFLQQNHNLQQLIQAQHHELSQTHESLRSELKLGAKIHDVLLMGQVPSAVPSLAIDTFVVASRDIDGDFFDFYQPAEQICDLVIGDVMGKGLPAALVGTAVKTQLLRFAAPQQSTTLCTTSGVWEAAIPTPEDILQNVHRAVTASLINLGYFVTLFYARFNLERRTVSFVDCGSTKPIRYRASDGGVEELKGENFPVGMVKEEEYRTTIVPFADNDIFVFLSDGVTETRTPNGELFGSERLQALIAENGHLSPHDLVNLITESLRQFSGKSTFDDDVTLIVVKCLESAPFNTNDIRASAKFSSSLEQLPAVRQFIEQQCVSIPGEREAFSSQLQLAINEVFCNIARHGYGERPNGEVALSILREQDGLLVEISDRTDGFDPIKVDAPSLAGDREGGYGLFILKELSTNLSYQRRTTPNGWNKLQFFKPFNLGLSTMELQHTEQDGVLLVSLNADNLDARHATTFKDNLLGLIDTAETFNVVLDLEPLQFIDSSGLGSLLSVLRHLNSQGGDLKIANMTKPIRAMFEIVRMHKLFEIYNSTADAVRSFGTESKSTV